MISEADLVHAPYACYDALRAQGPLHWSEAFCGGAWLLTGHADIAAALKDPRFSVARTARWINSSVETAHLENTQIRHERDKLKALKGLFSRALLFVEERRHHRLRKAMQSGFKVDFLTTFTPRITAIAERLMDQILAKKSAADARNQHFPFDFMTEFARPLPALVMADLLGMDADRYPDVMRWSDDIATFIGSMHPVMEDALKAQASLAAMCACLTSVIEKKRSRPDQDLLGVLLHAQASGKMTHNELLVQCCMFVFAGYETTRNLLGNGLFALLKHPGQWASVKEAPQRWPVAIKELLRYESPVQYTARRLTDNVTLHGQPLQKGDLVILLIGAANYDPQRFTAPHQLDIARNEGNHLSFGYGAHACIGAALTYMEAEIAFKAVARHIPDIQLCSAEASWHGNTVYRGLQHLMVTCV